MASSRASGNLLPATGIAVRGYHLDGYGHVNHARFVESPEEARWASLSGHDEPGGRSGTVVRRVSRADGPLVAEAAVACSWSRDGGSGRPVPLADRIFQCFQALSRSACGARIR